MVLEQLDIWWWVGGVKCDPYLTPYTNIILRWTIHQNVKAQTIKFSGGNIGGWFSDLWVDKSFLKKKKKGNNNNIGKKKSLKKQNIKRKSDNLDLITIKNFLLKDTF